MSDLTDAVALLRQYQEQIEAEHERMKAEMVLMEFIEQAGNVPTLIAELKAECERLRDEKDLLTLDVAMLTQDRERLAGGPGPKEDRHELGRGE